MPRKDTRLVWQRKHLLLNALHQLIQVAARQVRPADATLEDQITAKENIFLRTIEHAMARRVSWRMADLEPVISNRKYPDRRQVYRWERAKGEFKPQPFAQAMVLQQFKVGGMKCHRQVGPLECLHQFRGTAEMIKDIVVKIKTNDLEIMFRMDRGSFDEEIIETIESLGCKYLIKTKEYLTLVSQVTDPSNLFVTGDEGRETAELFTKQNAWDKDRRFIVSWVLKPE